MKLLVVLFFGLVSVTSACQGVSGSGPPATTLIATATNTCFTSPGYPSSVPRTRCAWRYQAPAGTRLALTCTVNMKYPHGKLWTKDNANSELKWASGSGTYKQTFSGNDATIGLEGNRPTFPSWHWSNGGSGFSCCIIANKA